MSPKILLEKNEEELYFAVTSFKNPALIYIFSYPNRNLIKKKDIFYKLTIK